MALAYNHDEITPRELKPALLELDGISRETVEAHYKLYQGYVNKRNEILAQARRRRPRRPPTRSTRTSACAEGRPDVRDRWDQEPRGLLRASRWSRRRPGRRLRRSRRSATSARSTPGVPTSRRPASPAAAGRGRRTTSTRAGCSTTSATRRTPSRCGTPRRSSRSTSTSTPTSSTSAPTAARYIDAFFNNLDYDVVNDWVQRYGISRDRRLLPFAREFAARRPSATCSARARGGTGSFALSSTRTSAGRVAGTSARRTSGAPTAAGSAIPVVLLDTLKGFIPALARDAARVAPLPGGIVAGAAAMLGHWRPLFLGFATRRQDGRDVRRRVLRGRPVGRARPPVSSGSRRSSSFATRRSRRSWPASRCPSPPLAYGYPLSVIVFALAAFGAILFLHRGNLRRLRTGTESRFSFGRPRHA